MNGEHTSKPAHGTEDHRLGLESAFPMLDHNGNNLVMREQGLSKRELLAAMAMQAILTGAVTRGCPSHEWIDQGMAVRCADTLLKELAK